MGSDAQQPDWRRRRAEAVGAFRRPASLTAAPSWANLPGTRARIDPSILVIPRAII